ncbi:hypothetical protein [Rhodovulum marinum]|uniref:Uncharacterized protein n=1 Tax=Rhodovulum marinum TaxID=320662 RepID=A0A4R2Q603_9RHOB|nr:hypothetical protein [Rhodovulum marinum]TCP43929.1 hypothetical protein EV662_10112 [Rhodovulum marinum]
MPETPFSAEPIVIVRIEQPRCALSHGLAPCAATGAPCFNTYSTCRDRENYAPGATLDLYFGIPGQGRPADEIMILPFLAGPPSTSPARINVSGADRRVNPLGIRAAATITFRDAPHSDLLVDPYRSARSYDPLAQGTFWSKWLARNTFGKAGMVVSIFEGFAGDALADMVKRVYLCDAVDFSSDEIVTMKCRDVLSKAADEKAQCPPISEGELATDISAAAASIQVAGAVLGDYPAAGTIRINDEVMTYSAISEAEGGLLEFTITARGSDGTEAAEHAAEDRVQECFRFSGETVDQGLAALYGFTTIPAAYLPFSDWAAEAGQYLTAYTLTGLVTEPTPVVDLVGEVLEQTQSLQWWDEVAAKVRFAAVKPIVERPVRLTESEHLVAGTVRIRDFPERRVSRVYVYFDPRDPTASRDDEDNYRRIQGSLDLPIEDEKAFGDKAIRKIFARFVNSGAVALETTSRILSRYRLGSREVSFAVSDKDGGLGVGEIVEILFHRLQGTTGAPESRFWIVTSRDPRPSERRVYYTAEDATLAGTLSEIAEDSLGDYVGDGSDPFGVAWISDDNGFLPDGSEGFKIR